MKFIIIHRSKDCTTDNSGLLQFAICNEPIASLILKGLGRGFPRSGILGSLWGRNSKIVCAIPGEWGIEHLATTPEIMTYTENIPICSDAVRTKRGFLQSSVPNAWCVFANGRFATHINNMELLNKVLADSQVDVLAVNAEPELLGYREKVRLTAENKVAGFRRLYSDSAEPVPIPADWPHFVFIKTDVLDRILVDHSFASLEDKVLPESFSAFLQRCRSAGLTLCAFKVAGAVFDLETEEGLLNFCSTKLRKIHNSKFKILNSKTISQDSRLVGKVLLGKNIRIGPRAVVIGPTIIGDNVKIEKGAVINSSIIGPGVCVPENQVVQNCVVKGPLDSRFSILDSRRVSSIRYRASTNETFRSWPRLSYAGSFKQIADCLAAIIVLILFAPIMPFIVLAIKLASPGPVFFKDKRQGLHGKEFYCLKFRSMAVGAERIQDKLRIVSEVDGPQFKIADDPRISAVGRFLRDTYIDEIPQFFNVLLGQMSVVGPRPSPESENTLCPFWRDARLSVRPGITGLWQMRRTRNPSKDFQEWIHWDSEYVRNLSLRMDLWICWQTTKRLVNDVLSQF